MGSFVQIGQNRMGVGRYWSKMAKNRRTSLMDIPLGPWPNKHNCWMILFVIYSFICFRSLRLAIYNPKYLSRYIKVSKSQKKFILKPHCQKSYLSYWQISALANKMGQRKKLAHNITIIRGYSFNINYNKKPIFLWFDPF